MTSLQLVILDLQISFSLLEMALLFINLDQFILYELFQKFYSCSDLEKPTFLI